MKRRIAPCAALLALVALTACGDKDKHYEELIVGKWEQQSCYTRYHDFTDESLSWEGYSYLPDSNFAGYDTIQFNANGTARYNLNDRWVRQGMFDYHHRDYEWRIVGDSLFVYTNTVGDGMNYQIKQLDNETLVVEEYLNNYPPLYSQHHHEEKHTNTFKRIK